MASVVGCLNCWKVSDIIAVQIKTITVSIVMISIRIVVMVVAISVNFDCFCDYDFPRECSHCFNEYCSYSCYCWQLFCIFHMQ